jgi:hypothetical protein
MAITILVQATSADYANGVDRVVKPFSHMRYSILSWAKRLPSIAMIESFIVGHDIGRFSWYCMRPRFWQRLPAMTKGWFRLARIPRGDHCADECVDFVTHIAD